VVSAFAGGSHPRHFAARYALSLKIPEPDCLKAVLTRSAARPSLADRPNLKRPALMAGREWSIEFRAAGVVAAE
jgi:hypothetical protein